LRDQAIARGVRVPEDMAIIGAGDHIVCTYREPTLTSVAFPWRKMGEAAALALLHKQRGNVHPPVARLRPVTVVARTSTRTPAIQDRLVRDALSWMRRHLPSSRPADEAAAALGTTPSTLTRRFRKALSRTPKQEHTRLRIEKAEKMLLSSERSLEAIARACGFNGAVPFSVAFKRSRGTSPGQWRKAQ
jgi:LacI family transcriptional regulator